MPENISYSAPRSFLFFEIFFTNQSCEKLRKSAEELHFVTKSQLELLLNFKTASIFLLESLVKLCLH